MNFSSLYLSFFPRCTLIFVTTITTTETQKLEWESKIYTFLLNKKQIHKHTEIIKIIIFFFKSSPHLFGILIDLHLHEEKRRKNHFCMFKCVVYVCLIKKWFLIFFVVLVEVIKISYFFLFSHSFSLSLSLSSLSLSQEITVFFNGVFFNLDYTIYFRIYGNTHIKL